jgi:hypothetical protein
MVCLPALDVSARSHDSNLTLQGTVSSAGLGLASYQVSLYGSFIQSGPRWQLLGSGTTDSSGHFTISYVVDGSWNQDQPVLFVEATRGSSMLASVIGIGLGAPASVVVNELTTVATANAFAQFIGSVSIQGNFYGMKNAFSMLGNLADPVTGNVGIVLSSTPNGTETFTYATFNSLANLVAGCVANSANCAQLISVTTPTGQSPPANVLQALANLVNYPSYPGYPFDNQDPIFMLSQADPVYPPALPHRPTSWLLFLKITGGFYSQQDANNLMNGPGAFAVDSKGFVWLDNNYIPEPPQDYACAGTRAMKFDPSGASAPGSPYFGGGISGSGWGVFVDASDNAWITNFGFQDPPCALLQNRAPHNAISEFASDGTPLSPTQGFTDGNMSWPMGAALDRSGNIWVANCGNDTVTRYAGGDHSYASSIALGASVSPNNPQVKPFGVAVDGLGNVWITNNRGNSVSILSPDGRVIKTIPAVYNDKTILTHPIGNATDIEGNMWVANSDFLDAPCPTRNMVGPAENPSISLFHADTQQPDSHSPFSGGGVTLPWGLLVDGKDTVWVFNFGAEPFRRTPPNATTGTAVSRFCGENAANCPQGLRTGDPISPETGYQSNAITRITGGAVDPSGNLWMTDNWKINVNPFKNPGGNAIVIAIGAAAPIQTPVIGPPVPFQ